jgi:hypothetical protein
MVISDRLILSHTVSTPDASTESLQSFTFRATVRNFIPSEGSVGVQLLAQKR